MRGKLVFAGIVLALSGTVVGAQDQPQEPVPVPIENDLYCSGIVTTESVPRSSYIITGEESDYLITFDMGDYVYINRGGQQGVKVGDEFSVVRPVVDPIFYEWTKWQYAILRKMGTVWEDEGRVKVVVVQQNTSIAQVAHTCNSLQRGDIIVPFAERTAPPMKPEANFDRFAPASGKAKAMVIEGKKFQQAAGTNDVVYVNLGQHQGVRVGDYFRVFRYTGTEHETAYQTSRFAFDIEGTWGPVFGMGAAPSKWDWSNTPREVLGEGVVIRTAPNASTVLLTFSLREIFPGDYVEIE
jgi:Flagellar assembly protein T, C-terminal domain